MSISIEISQYSQELISRYRRACDPILSQLLPEAPPSDVVSLLSWLEDRTLISRALPKEDKELEFIHISLRTELLHDLCHSMQGDNAVIKETNRKLATQEKIKFILLTGAGILVAGCEGFDSIVTMMSIFSLPSVVILACGIIFSLLSIITFCGLDFVKLSNSIGVKLSDTHKILDVYIRQFDEIKQIRKKIKAYNLSILSLAELQQLALIIRSLEQRITELAKTSQQFDEVLNSTQMRLAQYAVSGVGATLFFGGAFCAGQTVSTYVLGLFITAITPASIPVVIFSLAVGLAAFSLYWCIELPGLKTLIQGWFGLTEEKTAVLCDNALFVKEEKKLVALKEKVIGTSQLKEQLLQLEHDVPVKGPAENKPLVSSTHEVTNIGANIYCFMKPPSLSVVRSAQIHEVPKGVACNL